MIMAVTGSGNDDLLVPEAGTGDQQCEDDDKTKCDKPRRFETVHKALVIPAKAGTHLPMFRHVARLGDGSPPARG